MSIMETFVQQVPLYCPGFLYRFNIADLKRRNCHLGHLIGDNDIRDFDQLLKAVAAKCLVQRVEGDVWLLLSRGDETRLAQRVLDEYRRTEKIETGWQTDARNGDESAQNRRLVSSEIRRAARCLFAPVLNANKLPSLLEKLAEGNRAAPVDQVLPLRSVAQKASTDWSCVIRYPADLPDCPFCHGRDFAWEDGDMSVYSGSGTCKQCGAEVSITQIDLVTQKELRASDDPINSSIPRP